MSIVNATLYDRAAATAARAKDGTLMHREQLYRLTFSRNEWVYVVTDADGEIVVRLNVKNLAAAKRELINWLES